MPQIYLLNQVDSVSELLALQEGMDVVEQMAKVLLLVPVGHEDGRFVAGKAVRGPVVTTRLNERISFHDHPFTGEHLEGDG